MTQFLFNIMDHHIIYSLVVRNVDGIILENIPDIGEQDSSVPVIRHMSPIVHAGNLKGIFYNF